MNDNTITTKSRVKPSVIKLKHTPTCPGADQIEEFFGERGHLSYGIDTVDVAEGSLTHDFVNSPTTLVLSVDFERRYANDAMMQMLELGVLAVTTGAISFDYDWVDDSPSGDGDTRCYVVRIGWKQHVSKN